MKCNCCDNEATQTYEQTRRKGKEYEVFKIYLCVGCSNIWEYEKQNKSKQKHLKRRTQEHKENTYETKHGTWYR